RLYRSFVGVVAENVVTDERTADFFFFFFITSTEGDELHSLQVNVNPSSVVPTAVYHISRGDNERSNKRNLRYILAMNNIMLNLDLLSAVIVEPEGAYFRPMFSASTIRMQEYHYFRWHSVIILITE
ncbi:hypothetical protein GBAR_LOCUS12046, partial [Geodia barretti]